MNSSSATDCYASGRFDDTLRQVLRHWDDDHRRHAADAARGAAPDLFAGPAVSPTIRAGSAGAGRGRRCRGRDHRLHRRGRQRYRAVASLADMPSCNGRSTGRCAGSRSASTMKCAGKDLIDSVHPVGQDRPDPRRPAARGLQLRDVPRRKGREDLQVEGQRPQPRGMADLWQRGEPRLLHLSANRARRKSLHFGVIPRAVDEYWQFRGNYAGPATRAEARQPGPPHPRRRGPDRASCR